LPDVLTESVSRLERLTRQSDPAALARDEALAREAFMQPAVALSEARRKVAAELSSAVTEAMQSLAMSGACFEIALKPVEEGAASGLEAVEFLVTANASQPLRSMAKVASGGELSRIGLAIQVITSRSVATPTLIFDEVDVGIGGGWPRSSAACCVSWVLIVRFSASPISPGGSPG
jgi:DNA repair protein RecN (Recombination protein N)